MATNNYNGEIAITLHHKVYPMKINMEVIAKYQSEGFDYMRVAVRSINALRKTIGEAPLDQAQLMTEAVSLTEAATLFYLASKAMDKTVTFEEIQEAVLYEGPMMQQDILADGTIGALESYPIIFANLCIFATMGVVDAAKK